MLHPGERVALEHLVTASASIEVQLTSKAEYEPLREVLARARDDAAEAMIALTTVDPTKVDDIRALQNRFGMYRTLVEHFRQIVTDGKDAGRRLDDEREAELQQLILGNEEMAERIGLRTGAPTE
jgi:hypothetical protein